MINRILIRIKILQIVFAFYRNGNDDPNVAEHELLFSLRKSYDLYYYFLLLIIEVTRMQERRLDVRRHRYHPTEDELNPNIRLVNNRFASQLESNLMLQQYVKEHSISWANETGFVKKVLSLILDSDFYHSYMHSAEDTYEADREFWRMVFKKLICGNEELEEALGDISIYWNDDIEIIESFVIKTIKRFDESEGSRQELMPMFKDSEDYDFALNLFRHTLRDGDAYRERIIRHLKNWEMERIAGMDLIIMQVALAEIIHFPNIPISVTLNEYIDAAKYYSTPKSATFINGLLDSVVKELKKEKLLLKD
ncbi:MAG: transcription antitermination factor NusB [Tannerella sp.]|jgi:N utilization substance protein B|nr:transcription antitermination factor NusB [Tannerella sp.]